MERKKKEQIQGRTNRRRLILNPTIQLAIGNMYTKYKVSILNGFKDIFDKKKYSSKCMDRKKSEHIQGKTNRRRLVFYPKIQLVTGNLYTKYEHSVLHSRGDICDEKYGEKETRGP